MRSKLIFLSQALLSLFLLFSFFVLTPNVNQVSAFCNNGECCNWCAGADQCPNTPTGPVNICNGGSCCLGYSSSGGGGNPQPTGNVCATLEQSNISHQLCQGQAINSRCQGYPGTCEATTNVSGNIYNCACVPDSVGEERNECVNHGYQCYNQTCNTINRENQPYSCGDNSLQACCGNILPAPDPIDPEVCCRREEGLGNDIRTSYDYLPQSLCQSTITGLTLTPVSNTALCEPDPIETVCCKTVSTDGVGGTNTSYNYTLANQCISSTNEAFSTIEPNQQLCEANETVCCQTKSTSTGDIDFDEIPRNTCAPNSFSGAEVVDDALCTGDTDNTICCQYFNHDENRVQYNLITPEWCDNFGIQIHAPSVCQQQVCCRNNDTGVPRFTALSTCSNINGTEVHDNFCTGDVTSCGNSDSLCTGLDIGDTCGLYGTCDNTGSGTGCSCELYCGDSLNGICSEVPAGSSCTSEAGGQGYCVVDDGRGAGDGACSCIVPDIGGDPEPVPDEYHLTCQGEACVLVEGVGTKTCDTNADCSTVPQPPTGQRLACDTINDQCVVVNGDGAPECSSHSDCFDAPPPATQSHLACVSNTCSVVEGAGPNECGLAGLPCGGIQIDYVHTICSNEQCRYVRGQGENECNTDYDCGAPLPTHTVCDNVNQICAEVQGEGADECSDYDDCVTPSHSVCQNEACVVVDGEGDDECSLDEECAPPPDCDLCQFQLDIYWGEVIQSFLTYNDNNEVIQQRYSIPAPKRLIDSLIDKYHGELRGVACDLSPVEPEIYNYPEVENESECGNASRTGKLKGRIIDERAVTRDGRTVVTAEIENTTDNCTYNVGFASYKANWINEDHYGNGWSLWPEEIDNQNLFDFGEDVLQPGESTQITIKMPTVSNDDACYQQLTF